MRTSSLAQPFLATVTLMTALALLPPNARPEDKPPSTADTTVAQASKQPPKVYAAQTKYDLEIVNGEVIQKGPKKERVLATLATVVDVLRERYADANLVISPGLASLPIGDLKLRARNLPEELEAIRVAGGAKFDWIG